MTNIELYEELKPTIGDKAARMIAEVVPPSRELVTRADLAELRTDFAKLVTDFAKLRTEFAELRASFEAREARLMRVMVMFLAPLTLSVVGMFVSILVRGS
jgi:hypothetical protein